MSQMTTEAPPTPNFSNARVRLNRAGAELVWTLVLAEETRLLTARRQVDDDDVPRYQENIRTVRRVKDELERTLIEQGWID